MAIAKPRITEQEFLRLPDDGRKYELVDGEIKEVPAGVRHDAIGAKLIGLIYPFAESLGCLTNSQAGFRMKSGNIRCPDVGFTRYERFPDGEPPEGFGDFAPDLCIEIISTTEDPVDTMRKVREYFDAGAQVVWHLFPETQQAKIYTSPTAVTTYEADDELDGGDLIPGFRCRVAELFKVAKRPAT
jgi:Uma2 family endonuclease